MTPSGDVRIGHRSARRSGYAVVAAAAGCVVEALERRALLSGSISGTLSHDLNGNGAFDAGEPALSGWTVFLDQNKNRQRDAAEVSTVTNASGQYAFANVADGTYYVAQEVPVGWKQTYPTLDAPGVNESPAAAVPVADVAVETTGSGVAARVQGEVVEDAQPRPSDAQSNSLIRLTNFRADGRFAGIDGTGFSVAVLDTGIDLNHPFFGPDADGNGVADRIRYHYDFADNDASAADLNGHGSHVTSTIASQDATYSGMAPGADIIALKVFRDSGNTGSFSYIEKALQWLVANAAAYNIAAVNMSLGDEYNWNTPQQLYGIADEMAALAAQNVLVVSAAGNDYYKFQAAGVSYPAADPNSLAVGAVYDANVGTNRGYGSGARDATTGADRVTSFSQRSTSMSDIFAPGADITHANQSGTTSTLTGTSMASPHVAGLAVLAQQLAVQELGRRLTLAEFAALLKDTATAVYDGDDEDDNVANANADFGRVDALRLGEAITKMSAGEYYPLGHKVIVAGADRPSLNFGAAYDNAAPGAPTLAPVSDTGVSPTDRITKLDNATPAKALQVRVSGVRKGMTVDVLAGATVIGTGVATGSSIVITTNGAADMADGARVLTARQRATGVPTSAASAGTTVTIDTVAPATPAAPDLAAATDTGVSSTDNVTSETQPMFNLALGGAPYMQLYRNGSMLTFAYEPPYSSWDPWIHEIGDGPAQYTVGALDAAGNESVSAPLQVTIDTAAAPGASGPGSLDATFGDNGVVSSSGSHDAITAVARQPDGKLVVAGVAHNGINGFPDWVVARYHANGSVDTSFGTNGRATLHVRDSSEAITLLVQNDGRIVIAGWAGVRYEDGGWIHTEPRMAVARFTSSGAVDTTFGNGGVFMASTYPMTNNGVVREVIQQPDGKLLLTFRAGSNGNWADFGVARLTTSGTLDATFSGDGWATADFNQYIDEVYSMELLPDGKVLVFGNSWDRTASGTYKLAMMRFTATGALDATFDGDGKLVTPILMNLVSDDRQTPTLRQPDGKILLLATPKSTNTPSMMRFNPDGTLDASFGAGGVAPVGSFIAEGMALQPDGKIVIAGANGVLYRKGPSDALRRFNPDGSPDVLFGSNGLAHAYIHPQLSVSEYFRDVIVLPDGSIVGVGYTNMGTGGVFPERRFAMARFRGGDAAVAPLDLQAGSDTGASSTDNVTTDATPTFTLPNLHGGFARIYRDGTLLVGGYFNQPTFTAPTQAPGTSVYGIRFVDASGNETPEVTMTVTLDAAGPTGDIVDVTPDPRTTGVDTIDIVFSEPVTGFDLGDLALTRSDAAGTTANLLTDAQTLTTTDNKTFTLGGIGALTRPRGSYAITLNGGTAGVTDLVGRPFSASPVDTWMNENHAPTVAGVFVGSSAWLPLFADHLGSTGLGDAAFGYRVHAATQLDELPWTNLNTVSVRFSEDVRVSANDLVIRGVNVATYGARMTYDPATFTATWSLPAGSFFAADKLLLDLNAEGVVDAAGELLDGEWTNPTQPATGTNHIGHSGDGTPGGDFRFRINVLPGDVNWTGSILGSDVTLVRNAQGTEPGFGLYTIYKDVNGTGSILGSDVTLVRNRQGISLPEAEPTAAVEATADRSTAQATAPRTTAKAPPLFATGASSRSAMRLLARQFDLLGDVIEDPLVA